jgi:mRNA interferase YafQ
MDYSVQFTGQFKKDAKRCKKRNYKIPLLENAMRLLREKGEVPPILNPHKLSGNYKGLWECHLTPDWLLIWKQDDELREIFLERTGTHSDLFK